MICPQQQRSLPGFIRPLAFPANELFMPPAGQDKEYEWQHVKRFRLIETPTGFLSNVREPRARGCLKAI